MVLGSVENIMGKGEDADRQHCSFSYNILKIPSFLGLLKGETTGIS